MIDLSQIFNDTTSGIIINLPWFILIYMGFKAIAKELREGIKQIPNWFREYDKLRMKHYQIETAIKLKNKNL